jgi:broad specificity phosphatase PhoE
MTKEGLPGPRTLWVVRHGQSAGNVARDAAEAGGASIIDIADRDMDVPLSDLGHEQSAALARWFAKLPVADQPDVVLHSPYERASQTAHHVIEGLEIQGKAGNDIAVRCDERLREKEFGVLDRLTVLGIKQQHPLLAEQRARVGKFYFRPPGGESWCDVILRLRSVLDMVVRDYSERRVVIVAHQVIVLCLRYLLEDLQESTVLAIDRRGDIPNCSITSYENEPGDPPRLALRLESFVVPLEQAGAPVTSEPDAPVAAKP